MILLDFKDVKIGDTVIILKDSSNRYVGKRGIVIGIDEGENLLVIQFISGETRWVSRNLNSIDVFR